MYPRTSTLSKASSCPQVFTPHGISLPNEANGNTLRAPHDYESPFGDDDGFGSVGVVRPAPQAERAFPVAQLLPISGACSTCSVTCGRGRSIDGALPRRWKDHRRRRGFHARGRTTSNDAPGRLVCVRVFTARSAHRGDVTYFRNQTRDNVGSSRSDHAYERSFISNLC